MHYIGFPLKIQFFIIYLFIYLWKKQKTFKKITKNKKIRKSGLSTEIRCNFYLFFKDILKVDFQLKSNAMYHILVYIARI